MCFVVCPLEGKSIVASYETDDHLGATGFPSHHGVFVTRAASCYVHSLGRSV